MVCDAVLLNARGVRLRLAVRADQHLTTERNPRRVRVPGDHLYSFWLDGTFWGAHDAELTSPDTPDEGSRTADVPFAELDLAAGATVAYVFDVGDGWRVRLTMRATEPADTAPTLASCNAPPTRPQSTRRSTTSSAARGRRPSRSNPEHQDCTGTD